MIQLKNSIHEYVVNRKGERVGCILGIGDETGNFALSWSLCNIRLDEFNKNLAIKIAKNRAEQMLENDSPSTWNESGRNIYVHLEDSIPVSIKKHYSEMLSRCLRYFKIG